MTLFVSSLPSAVRQNSGGTTKNLSVGIAFFCSCWVFLGRRQNFRIVFFFFLFSFKLCFYGYGIFTFYFWFAQDVQFRQKLTKAVLHCSVSLQMFFFPGLGRIQWSFFNYNERYDFTTKTSQLQSFLSSLFFTDNQKAHQAQHIKWITQCSYSGHLSWNFKPHWDLQICVQ